MHLVVINSHLFLFQLTRSGMFQTLRNRNTIATKAARRAALFADVPNCKLFLGRIGAIFLITVYFTAFERPVPDARSHSPTSSSQALKLDSKPSAWSHQSFAGIYDLLHQCILTILCVWSVSAVYQTPCISSVGFFNGSDRGSNTLFRDQSQRAINLYAAFQMCFTQRFRGCQGCMIPFFFALVHQRVRHRTADAHVDSKAEAKVLIVSVVPIERLRLAQASQVFEQVCINRFRHCEAVLPLSRWSHRSYSY